MSEEPPTHQPSDSSDPSVLDYLASVLGNPPKVLLEQEGSDADASPVINPSSDEKHTTPKRRGGYQFLGEIARGGMGVVLKGHDNDLGRDVAVKVLHKELSHRPEILQRFVEEAQIGGQLQHPGIVPVYEMGLTGDKRPYFTMKLVKGRTLGELLAERSSPTEDRRRLLDVFESICQTMAYAHSRRVIHRDLKPANIMVGAFGEVQVVDWGLAKVMSRGGVADERSQKRAQTNISIIETVRSEPGSVGSHSMVGSVLGTPAYMAPEQARGDVERVNAASDVFSLAAILCEILTGAPPYVGSSEEVIEQAATARLEPALERLDQCGAEQDLIDLVKAALAPAITARPRSAQVFAERLQAYLASVEDRMRAAQIEAAEARVRAVDERKARRLTLALGGTILVSLLAAGGGWLWMNNRQVERERKLGSEIAASLNEAVRLRGKERWAEALAAAQQAEALARTAGIATADAEIEAELEQIQAEMAAAARSKELEAANAQLLADLADVRVPGVQFMNASGARQDAAVLARWREEQSEVDRAHADLFARHGLPVTEEEAFVGAIRERGIGREIASTLDSWSLLRRQIGDEPGSLQLRGLSDRCDADEVRRKMRPAIFAAKLGELEKLARSSEIEQLTPEGLGLLGSALSALGDRQAAIRIFQKAVDLEPEDFSLRLSLAREFLHTVTTPGPGGGIMNAFAVFGHYEVALLLRPNSQQLCREYGMLNLILGNSRAAVHILRKVAPAEDDDTYRALFIVALLTENELDEAVEVAQAAPGLKNVWPGELQQWQTLLAGTSVVGLNPQLLDTFSERTGLPSSEARPSPSPTAHRVPPARPSNLAPAVDGTVEGELVLVSSDFKQEDAKHFGTRWQIREESGSYERNPVVDLLDFADQRIDYRVPRGLLRPGRRYYWRVTHMSDAYILSEPSEETSFELLPARRELVAVDLSAYFNKDVVADSGDPSGDFLDSSGSRAVAQGFLGDTTGLPPDRVVGMHTLGDYSDLNSVQITLRSSQSIRIDVPTGKYDLLAILVAGGNGWSVVPIRIEYADGSFELQNVNVPDWYADPGDIGFPGGVTPIWNGMNRFYLGSLHENKDPAFFEVAFELQAGKELVAIDVHAPSANLEVAAKTCANILAMTLVRGED